MKANPDKCHLLISSKSQSDLKIGNKTNKSSTSERLLGIKIHNKLRLNTHIEDFVSVHTCNQQTFAIEMYKLLTYSGPMLHSQGNQSIFFVVK